MREGGGRRRRRREKEELGIAKRSSKPACGSSGNRFPAGFAGMPGDEFETFGSVFGVCWWVDGRRPGEVNTSHSECERCEDPTMLFAWWENYNYRICVRCWDHISCQLWEVLVDHLGEGPANLVWAYLIEPGQWPV